MSTSLTTMIRLRGIQNKLRQTIEDLDDRTIRTQFHPDLSPIGWHFGHCTYVENYWLHEIIQHNPQYTKKNSKLYTLNSTPRHKLGKKLPSLEQLLTEAQHANDLNDLMLIEMVPPLSNHPLFKDEYIQNYIIQHHAQHYEIMEIIRHQISLAGEFHDFEPVTPLVAKSLNKQLDQLPGGQYPIGGEQPFAYDNELPEHMVELETCNISNSPVTNAEYLAFMLDNGYHNADYWSADAWRWLQQNNITHPEYWRRNKHNEWYGLNDQGPFELNNQDYVYGISHYEASAFAHWAHARLPHETEWESFAKQNRIHNSGQVWEWCSNMFEPYANFKAFPSNNMLSSFNSGQYVLKGASQYTRPEIRRASFRNFYSPDKRYMFAGFRLAFD